MYKIYSQFNTTYFPWLAAEGNTKTHEITCNSYEDALKWVKDFGNPAYTYTVEKSNA